MRALVVAMIVAAVLAGVAWASVPLPAKTVDVQIRKVSLQDAHRFPNARTACSWSARTVTYSCTEWAPQPGSSTIVQGVPGKVFVSRSAQACGKLWSTSDLSKGCKTTTTSASCWFQVSHSPAVTTVNVCKAGWQKRLAAS